MNQSKKNSQHWQQSITCGLKSFGLNPNDWQIRLPESGRPQAMVIFQNKLDKEFQLLGHLQKACHSVVDVQLLSI